MLIWLLNQWRYNLVQKLVVHRHLLHFSLGLCGLILFSDFQTNFFFKKVIKNYTQITPALFLAHNCIFYIFFSNFWMLSELHNLNLKLRTKQYNEIDLLHLIVVPQLSGGWQHNHPTKTDRQAATMSSLCILLCLS